MKKLALLLITFFTLTASAQKEAMLEQANDMGLAFLRKDYEMFLKYTHPKVIQSMGGWDKMLQETRSAFNEIEAQGLTFLRVELGEPSKIINAGGELQALIPQTIVMRRPDGRITATSTLIAMSEDNGKKWYFMDAAGRTHATMKMLLPTLSEELELPAKAAPVFEPDTPPQDTPKQ